MCECYQVGGPWIAEDPNCPTHGIEARERRESQQTRVADILEQVDASSDVEELRELARRIAEIVEDL